MSATYPTGVKRSSRGKPVLSIMGTIRVLFVIALAAGIGMLILQKQGVLPSGVGSRASGVVSETTTPDARPATPVLLLLTDSSATLVDLNGSSTRMTRAEFDRRATGETRLASLEGANAANGSVVTVKNNLPPAPLTLRIGSIRLRDLRIHGWADAKTMYVTALKESVRAVFAVGTSGAVRELAPLPDNVLSIEVRRGALWYITANQGEGIETEPLPPSELHRVDLDGDHLVVKDDKRLILEGVPGPKGEVAVYFNDGKTEISGKDFGMRHPLVSLNDGRLVMRDGFDLILVDPATGETAKFGPLPEGSVEVYEMPRTP